MKALEILKENLEILELPRYFGKEDNIHQILRYKIAIKEIEELIGNNDIPKSDGSKGTPINGFTISGKNKQ